MPRGPRYTRGLRRTLFLLACALLLVLIGIAYELHTSRLQAKLLPSFGRRLSFAPGDGLSDTIRFPSAGPFDERLGYSRIPAMLDQLSPEEWHVTSQARWSAELTGSVELGLFPPYAEKPQAGLELLDRYGRPLLLEVQPRRILHTFEEIPPIVVGTLLFLENRELLDPDRPFLNPAVEWDRMALAAGTRALNSMGVGARAPGASTLATQLEKLRHSPGGITWSSSDKLRQVASASLRVYLGGPQTLAARERIVADYINAIPLAARPGIGSVYGLGDSLKVWYGEELDRVCELLSPTHFAADDPLLPARARAYRQVLSLFLAQKRPTFYLVQSWSALVALTDAHLRLMGNAGVVPEPLWRAALTVSLERISHVTPERYSTVADPKTTTMFRARLLPLLGLERVYDLDRLDLVARTALDAEVQGEVVAVLQQLTETDGKLSAELRKRGLVGSGDPARIIYSFTLFERQGDSNLLRVQADSLDQPLNLNDGSRLELGSTAKLRTLATYLEVIARLHGQITALDPQTPEVAGAELDPLSSWARGHLAAAADRSLEGMLDAALARVYSASPRETFITGGGAHRFHNFDGSDDGRRVTVREAFHRSVNLPFIRIMRDVVQHYIHRLPETARRALDDPASGERQEYVARFVEQESRLFLRRFYHRHQPLLPAERLEVLLAQGRPRPSRAAVVLRSVRPATSAADLTALLAELLPDVRLRGEVASALLERSAPPGLSWADRGYLAGVHPLELWVAAHLERFPESSWIDVVEASRDVRRDVYKWLTSSRRRSTQDLRVMSMLEAEAFSEIARDWQRQGYPFSSLVPSLATAIGSSGDRPAALAELVGIIIADGVRFPSVRVEELHFAAATPYETEVVRAAQTGEQVMPPAVARALRGALLGVVEHGTAQRARGAFAAPDGRPVPVGGKTGTGDNRRRRYGRGGRLVDEEVINRTATFAFFLGERHFGTVVAFVPGAEASRYRFTSALPSHVLRILAPVLEPLLESEEEGGAAQPRGGARGR